MFRFNIRFLGVGCGLVLLGTGCRKNIETVLPIHLPSPAPASSTEQALPIDHVEWSPRGNGIERTTVLFATSTASTIILYRFPLTRYQAAFEQNTSTAAISEWVKRVPGARFISNGVYFHDDLLPSGWLKTKNQVIGKRSFDADKSALLMLQPRIDIITLPTDLKKYQTVASEAAQSFPVLIQKGKASVKTESGKASRRTFVGIDTSKTFFYVGIVPYAGISLYELSQTLSRVAIPWETVLNLDGGPSSGMAFLDPYLSETVDSYVTVPSVLVISSHP